jgi:hypothetical protein
MSSSSSSSASSTASSVVETAKAKAVLVEDALKENLPEIPKSKEELKQDVEVAAKSTASGLRSLVAGGVGGICAVIVGM